VPYGHLPGVAPADVTADLGGQLTHNGVAGERSDLWDLRPAVMAARGSAMTDASAIMRVLKDGLIREPDVQGCPIAGRAEDRDCDVRDHLQVTG
jgi:hypothetical protein